MSTRAVAVACLVLVGCGDRVLVVVDGDREVPVQLDAICLGVGDRDPAGGQFGRLYRLEGELAHLPQSLAVEPGQASSADVWVRGYRGGVEVARDRAGTDFGGDVGLRVDRCVDAPSGAPDTITTAGPADATLAISTGRGGTRIAAAGGGVLSILHADGDTLLAATDGVAADGVLAIDADGDCDDDLVVWTAAGVQLLRRDADDFTDAGAIATDAIRAAAAADVDRDGDQDLVIGGGATLRLYRAGPSGFTADAVALPATGVSDVTALALGDLDGDGNPDLVVGQGDATGAPPRAFVADASGTGNFTASPAILPEVDLRVASLALADLDADDDLDLAVALTGAAARVYINRGGLLEDQSFVRLPQPAPDATAVAAGDWNGDCAPDLALGSALLRGADDGALVDDVSAPAASAAAFADVDDDGDLDLLLATPEGVAWLRR